MNSELRGQVAIVTGGGRGIGQAIAVALGREGFGVTVVARGAEPLAETVSVITGEGGKALALQADVTDLSSMQRAVAETEARFGPVDLLVNNAGVVGPLGPSWEVDAEEWRQCIEINLVGPYLGARAVLPGMVQRRKGRIINVSTGAAIRPMNYASAYSASKTGLTRLTESLALEVKEHGLGVFAITPGLVRTAMPESIATSEAGKRWLPRFSSGMLDTATPAERPAALCVLIASGAADSLSGRYLSVNDDIAELTRQAAQIEADNLYTLRLQSLTPRSR